MTSRVVQAASFQEQSHKIVGNSLALFTSQLLSKIFKVLANFLLARFLGPENFGTLALVLSFTELFRFLADFGLERTQVRRLARDSSSSGLSAALFLRGLFSGLAILGVWMALFFSGYDSNVRQLIYFYSLSFFLQSGSGVLAAYFQSQLKSASLIWAYTLSGLVYLGLVLTGIATEQGLPFFLVSLLATEGVLLTLFSFTFFNKGGKLAPFSFSELAPLVKEAFPFALWLALGTIYFRIDTLFVYHFTGERGTGLYSACFKLSEGFLMIATSAAASLFPVFSRLKKEGGGQLAALFEKSFFWFLSPTLLIAILVMGTSAPLVSFLYGEAYISAAPGLCVLIWSIVFMFANILTTQALVACDREKSMAKITVVNVLVNLSLNFYLVPRLGFIGACWATLATEAVNFFLQTMVLQKLLARKLFIRILPHFLAPTAAILWFYFQPVGFKTAGVWLFAFGYLVFIFNRRGQRE